MRPQQRWRKTWRTTCAGPVTRSRAGISRRSSLASRAAPALRNRCPACAESLEALSLDPFQASIRIFKTELCRVPCAPNPLLHFLVLLVLWISHRVHKFGVTGASAAVLWRAGVGSAQTDLMFEVGVGRQDLFDENLVLPTIPEVVFVNELLLRPRREIGHGVALLVQHLGVPFAVRLAVISAPSSSAERRGGKE